jgi:hypothetical protein
MLIIALVRRDKGVVRRVAGAKVEIRTVRPIDIHGAFVADLRQFTDSAPLAAAESYCLMLCSLCGHYLLHKAKWYAPFQNPLGDLGENSSRHGMTAKAVGYRAHGEGDPRRGGKAGEHIGWFQIQRSGFFPRTKHAGLEPARD